MTTTTTTPSRASLSASRPSTNARRPEMIVTSVFFTRNRFAALPVEACPIRVRVGSRLKEGTARERRAARRVHLRRTPFRTRALSAPPPTVVSPVKPASTTYRRYFFGTPPQEMYTLSEMRLADRLVARFPSASPKKTTRRVRGRKMSVELPLRERMFRRNLLRSLTVLEFSTRPEDSNYVPDWNMDF